VLPPIVGSLDFGDLELLFRELAMQYGYLGVFVISFLSASSIVIPVPYTVIILFLGAYTQMDMVMLALASGLGSALGEIVGYAVGRTAHHVVKEERKKKMEAMLKVLTAKGYLAPILVFLFALTPLPDDLLFIPLGLLGYPVLMWLLPCFVGKMFMAYIVAYAGRSYNQYLIAVLGAESTGWTMALTSVASTALLLLVMVAMLKVDWEALLVKMGGLKPSSDC